MSGSGYSSRLRADRSPRVTLPRNPPLWEYASALLAGTLTGALRCGGALVALALIAYAAGWGALDSFWGVVYWCIGAGAALGFCITLGKLMRGGMR